jgi:RNA polymerase sigma-70 factor, ECF subfamily
MTSCTCERTFDPDRAPSGRRLDVDSLGSHRSRLYRVAYGLCGSSQDAEDLVQDTYERVLQRPRFVRRDQDVGYLLRALRNTWLNSRRGREAGIVKAPVEEIDDLQGADDPIARKIDGVVVFDSLRELSQPLREALVAVDVVGLSYREAADALGTKEGTIMSRLHRGRGFLATQLGVTGARAC